jgi:hypothetical protein
MLMLLRPGGGRAVADDGPDPSATAVIKESVGAGVHDQRWRA